MALKQVLGRTHLTVYGVGVIVGAGIYSVIGAAAGLAQDRLWLSFLVGAGVAGLTALSYAEMATLMPRAGAEYVYLRRAWPRADWLSFGVGAVLLFGGAAEAATVATAFGDYLRYFFQVPALVSALALLAACTAMNIVGLREAGRLNMAFTAVAVGGLLIVAAAALWGEPRAAPPPPIEPAVMPAAALLFFVYLGFEEVANLAEEARRPTRDLPFALFASLGLTTVLYVMVAVAAVRLTPAAELAASGAPLATAVESVWPRAGGLLAGVALFATANTVLITLIAASRLAYSMGRAGELPGVFARLSKGRRTPWAAALALCALAMTMAPASSVRLLAEMSSFAALLAFMAVNAALIMLRYRAPDAPRPFRVPLSVGRLPLLPVAAILAICGLLVHFERTVYAAAAVALALSAAAWLVLRGLRRTRS